MQYDLMEYVDFMDRLKVDLGERARGIMIKTMANHSLLEKEHPQDTLHRVMYDDKTDQIIFEYSDGSKVSKRAH